MKTVLLTTLAIVLAGCQTLPDASSPEHFKHRTYEGAMDSAGEPVLAYTYFNEEQGVITGRYVAYEEIERADATPTIGALTACHQVAPRQLQCRWDDKYGYGMAAFVFSVDHSSFIGAWSADHDPRDAAHMYNWYGQEPTPQSACDCGCQE
jgi:hypothetical protein